jgi:predicted nucleic acid-binding protein
LGGSDTPTANNGLGWSVDRTAEELASLKYLFTVLADSDAIFSEWEKLVVRHRVAGKQAHDARLVAAMLVHGVTHLLTLNTGDFERYDEITIVNPQDVT